MNPVFEHLRKAASAYQESAVLAAAAELDVFTALLKRAEMERSHLEYAHPVTANELAKSMNVDLRALTVLLDVLAAQGFLVKSKATGGDAAYSVVDCFKNLLDSRSPDTFIPMLRHLAHVQRNWTQLAFTIKNGKPAEPQGSFLGKEQDYVSFIWAMNSLGRMHVKPVVESLQRAGVGPFASGNTEKKIRFLDIGAASGTYIQAFLEHLPRSEGTLFDLPPGVEAARQRFVGSEFENRVTLVEGDFTTDVLPPGHDFAWISAIIHQMGRNESRDLYRKTFAALNNGGTVAIRDFMMNSNRTNPKDGAFFGVNMLVATETGRVYSFDEVREDLEASGFSDVFLAVPTDTMSAIVTAKKP